MISVSRLLGPFRRRRGVRLAVLPFRSERAAASESAHPDDRAAAPESAHPDDWAAASGGARPAEGAAAPEEVHDPGDDELGVGFAEALIERLSGDAGLDVIGPISARALARRAPDPVAAAAELGADLLVTGEVRRTERELVVAARLRTAPEGAEVWTDRWLHAPEDVFLVLGEVAARISGAVGRRRTTPADTLLHREPTSDLAAWDLYVHGRSLLARPTRASLRAALDAFEASLEHDDLFPGAVAAIAETYRTAHQLHVPIDREDLLPAVRRGALRALELDDALPDAWVSRAYVELHEWDLDAAEEQLRRAVGVAPCHAQAHRLLARTLLLRRDLAGATSAAERALALEPLSDTVLNESGLPHALAGRVNVAIERSRRVVHRDPENVMAYFHLGRYAEQLGRHGEAVTYHRAAAELSGSIPYLTAFLGMVLALTGDSHEAGDIANDLERKARRGSPVATCLGVLLLRLGRVDEGVPWLEAALSAREAQLLLLDTPWLPLPEPHGHPGIRKVREALPGPR